MGQRVQDDGESESHFVMKWIEVESDDNSTSHESVLTSIGSSRTREFGQLIQEAKQMTAQAGAASRGEPMRQPQARIVQVIIVARW